MGTHHMKTHLKSVRATITRLTSLLAALSVPGARCREARHRWLKAILGAGSVIACLGLVTCQEALAQAPTPTPPAPEPQPQLVANAMARPAGGEFETTASAVVGGAGWRILNGG